MKSRHSLLPLLKGLVVAFLLREVIYFVYQLSKILSLVITSELDVWRPLFIVFLLIMVIGEVMVFRKIFEIKAKALFLAFLSCLFLNFFVNILESYIHVELGVDYLYVMGAEEKMAHYPSRVFQLHGYALVVFILLYFLYNRKKISV